MCSLSARSMGASSPNPCPCESPGRALARAPPCEPLLTTPFFPPLVPQPEGQAAGPPASKRRPAEIKEHPAADKLLAALSSYQRPYLVEETPESAGHPAASYAGPPRALSPGLPTPPREPRTKLTDSLVQEIDDRKTLAARSAIARQAPTVMTRAFAATTERQADESPPPDAVGARPRRRGLPLVLVGGAVVGILAFVGFLALAGERDRPHRWSLPLRLGRRWSRLRQAPAARAVAGRHG